MHAALQFSAITRRRSLARRVVGCLLTAFLGFFQVEGLLPDICDGSATPSEVLAFAKSGSSDLSSAEIDAARAREDARPLDATNTERTSSEAVSDSPTESGDGTAPSPHTTHACHCVHAHGGVLADVEDVASPATTLANRVASARDVAPASMSYQPPLRPPVA